MRTFANRRCLGFTLVELLAVIAILGILAAFLLPAIGRSRHMAREKQCLSNMRQIHTALSMYATDHNGWFPVEPTEHNPHLGLIDALNAEVGSSLMRCFYCSEDYLLEPYAQDTTHYLPIGESDSVLDTEANNCAGNISYVYWSFLANKPGWRNTSVFTPRLLRQDGPVQAPGGPPVPTQSPSETWILSDWFRRGAPFPHTRGHAQGLNVLFVDGHAEFIQGRPRDNYR